MGNYAFVVFTFINSNFKSMPAKDKYHHQVRRALEKDGWSITHDPYFLKLEGVQYPVDLGAEKLIAAHKGPSKDSSRDQEFYW